jgi:hypothetical protein
MLRIMASVLLIGLAVIARGQDTRELEITPDGGFSPRGANFHVTFQLAKMESVPPDVSKTADGAKVGGSLWPARTWSSVPGGTARLEYCCVKRPLGLDEVTLAAARLRVNNPTDRPFQTTLAVAITPRDVIYGLAFDRHAFQIEGRLVLVADTPSRGAILADSPFAARPLSPQNQAHVESAKGECRGEMIFDLTIEPGKAQTLGFFCPVQIPQGKEPDLDFYRTLSVDELFTQAAGRQGR